MKAMILAAGKGERMRPLTEQTPKPLLQAAGKPLIEYQIERLAAAGWRDLVINHAWLGDQIEAYLGNGERFGVHIDYSREGEPLETAGGIRRALPLLCAGNDWFLVINGDIWCDFDFRAIPDPEPGNLAWLLMVTSPPHHPGGDFVLGEKGEVTENGAGQRLTFAGISLLHRRLFAKIADAQPSRLAPLLRHAMRNHQVKGHFHPGHWYDIGTPERLTALDQWLQQENP